MMLSVSPNAALDRGAHEYRLIADRLDVEFVR
jgi:hypothetical protein